MLLEDARAMLNIHEYCSYSLYAITIWLSFVKLHYLLVSARSLGVGRIALHEALMTSFASCKRSLMMAIESKHCYLSIRNASPSLATTSTSSSCP